MTPQWTHGYRCHGYSIDSHNVRYGCVGIGPGLVPKTGGYSWEFTPHGSQSVTGLVEGTADTLRQAKRAVERLYAEWVRKHGPPKPPSGVQPWT
jgi:hypothetical protein